MSLVSLVLAGCGATSGEPQNASQTAASQTAASQTAASQTAAGRTKLTGAVANAVDLKDANARGAKTGMPVALALEPLVAERPSCRPGMVSIEGRYCIDRYEASLVEVLPGGVERPFSPFETIGSANVRAVTEARVYPQGYVSATQASKACAASGKRLCSVGEWQQACRGPQNLRYGYAEQRQPGRCNDKGKNPVMSLFGPRYDASTMNQPTLNQMAGTLAKTGEHTSCSNGYGVYDMVGNLHEWVADPGGTFYGGYYQDVSSIGHGDGCGYQTTAHSARYHDYSTGFRCCADALGSEDVAASAPAFPPPRAKPRPAKIKRRH